MRWHPLPSSPGFQGPEDERGPINDKKGLSLFAHFKSVLH